MKIRKGKKYKCARGTGSQTVPKFLLPQEYQKERYIEIKSKLQKEMSQKESSGASKEVKLTDSGQGAAQNEGLTDLHLPGVKGQAGRTLEEVKQQSASSQAPTKKPMIVEMKDRPESFSVEEGGDDVVLTIKVEKETSAKEIDLDICPTELKLESEK